MLLLLAILFSLATPAFALDTPTVVSSGACVIDGQTGELIWGYNEDKSLVPASMTKIMTVYLTYEAMADGSISKDTVVPISSNVSSFSKNKRYSNVSLYQNATYTIDELLNVVIVSSGCAATEALGELIGGTTKSFVGRMNDKAAELGLDAVFYDCYGGSASNRITPASMAKLAYELIRKYPDFLNYSSKASYSFHGKTYWTTNKFISGAYTCNAKVDGVKTGTTTAAGKCMTVSAIQNDNRVITVTMNSTTSGRYTDSRALVNYGVAYIQEKLDEGYVYLEPEMASVLIDGSVYELSAYKTGGTNYVRLRDVASLLNGTDRSFEITYTYAADSVQITTGTAYTPTGRELSALDSGKIMTRSHEQNLTTDGQENKVKTYKVAGTNYMKLRDIAEAAGFEVDWDNAEGNVIIQAKKLSGEPEAAGQSTETVNGAEPAENSTGQMMAGEDFTDVDAGDWYYEAVNYVKDKGIMVGTSGTEFTPDISLSRAMMAKILYNMRGEPQYPETKGFEDVSKDAWYYDAVNWAQCTGVVKGFEDGKFYPDESLTNQQVSAMLYRYAVYRGHDVSQQGDLSEYRDLKSIAGWAKNYVAWAEALHLFHEDGSQQFHPAKETTRAETAEVLMNFYKKYS